MIVTLKSRPFGSNRNKLAQLLYDRLDYQYLAKNLLPRLVAG